MNGAGWPRPALPVNQTIREEKGIRQSRLPVMWVAGSYPAKEQWIAFDHFRMEKCTDDNLCIVCGEPNDDDYIEARLDNNLVGAATRGHRRCIRLAVVSCPHFRSMNPVAYTPDGQHLTIEDLKRRS